MNQDDTVNMWRDEFWKSNKKLDEAYQKILKLELELAKAQIAKRNRLAEIKAYEKRCQWRDRLHPPIDYDDEYYGGDE